MEGDADGFRLCTNYGKSARAFLRFLFEASERADVLVWVPRPQGPALYVLYVTATRHKMTALVHSVVGKLWRLEPVSFSFTTRTDVSGCKGPRQNLCLTHCMSWHTLVAAPQHEPMGLAPIYLRLGVTHYIPSSPPTDERIECSALPEIVELSPGLPAVLADIVTAYL